MANPKWILLACLIAVAVGCRARSTAESPHTHPVLARRGAFETFRVAEPRDLNLYIYGLRPGENGFPYVLLILQNIGTEAVLVPYGPGSVRVRCGPYVQGGPGGVDRVRREVLGPGELIALSPPEGGWGEASAAGGQADLIVPERLPPGKYEISATYQLPDPPGGVVRSDRRMYDVR